MTTHWNGSLTEATHLLPAESASDARRSRRLGAQPQHSYLLMTMEANEVFLACLEVTPDYSHCGINE